MSPFPTPKLTRCENGSVMTIRGDLLNIGGGGAAIIVDVLFPADVARCVELLLNADAKAVAGQAFNCYDRYVAEQDVARIARELSGSQSEIADLNRGPKHQIETRKIRALGMAFGGEPLLRRTVKELVEAHHESKR